MTKLHEIPGVCAETRYTLWPEQLAPDLKARVLRALDAGYLVGKPESMTFQIIRTLSKGLSQRFARDVHMPVSGRLSTFSQKKAPTMDLYYPLGALYLMEDELADLSRELQVRHQIACAAAGEKAQKGRRLAPDLTGNCDRRAGFGMITPDDPRMHRFVAAMVAKMDSKFRYDMTLMADMIRSGEAVDYTVSHVSGKTKAVKA